MDSDIALREQLVNFLKGGLAHMTFDEAIVNFPMDQINELGPNMKYSPWQILEHMRFVQFDLLDFIQNPDYKEPKEEEYSPINHIQADEENWQKTIENFKTDLDSIIKIVQDPKTDLNSKIPWGDGQTILREILLVISHNSYEIGEFALLRQVIQTWPKNHK